MKFYTKEVYEQMQVYGYLPFFINEGEVEESLEETREYFKNQGIDYDVVRKNCFEEMKPYLLKYLPKSLKSIIYDEGLIYGKLLNNVLKEEIEKYKKNLNKMFVEIGKNYDNHYKNIENSLAEDIKSLGKLCSFHDSRIMSIEYLSKEEITIKLDCKGSYLPSEGVATLKFQNVMFAEISDKHIGGSWVYGEVHLSTIACFDFRALLCNCQHNSSFQGDELRIVADKVSLSF